MGHSDMADRLNGKRWKASDTALLAYYRGQGWPAWRIARTLGFCVKTVQVRLATMGWARPPGRLPLTPIKCLDILIPHLPI
jgi:hypothetical protein